MKKITIARVIIITVLVILGGSNLMRASGPEPTPMCWPGSPCASK